MTTYRACKRGPNNVLYETLDFETPEAARARGLEVWGEVHEVHALSKDEHGNRLRFTLDMTPKETSS
jgi:hypothetical protein